LNEALKNWIKCKYMGININEGHVYTLLFADDQVITGKDEGDINYMMRKLIEYNTWGLEIDLDKTHYMLVGGQGQDIITDYGTIKTTSQYRYLGVSLTSDGRDDRDICNKIVQRKKIIRQLHSLLWNDIISKNTKQRIFKSIVEPPTIYGAEVCAMDSKLSKKNNAVEMSFWRRCCVLTLEDIIREITETEETLTDTVDAKQLKWYGHMERMDEDLRKYMNGLQLKGIREEDREILGRRRQNKQWMEEIYGKKTT
jgi:hypothetical protein